MTDLEEAEALKDLQYAIEAMRSALDDAQWCWSALENENYYVWRHTPDDELAFEFEEVLESMVTAQRDYEQAKEHAVKALRRVLTVLGYD